MSVLGQMPARSGSPQAVFGGVYDGFCCAYVPAANKVARASAMQVFRIMDSSSVRLQADRQVHLKVDTTYGQLIDRLAVRRFLLGNSRRFQNPLNPFVALVARVLEYRLAVVARKQHTERPRPHPRVRIVEGDRPVDAPVR